MTVTSQSGEAPGWKSQRTFPYNGEFPSPKTWRHGCCTRIT